MEIFSLHVDRIFDLGRRKSFRCFHIHDFFPAGEIDFDAVYDA